MLRKKGFLSALFLSFASLAGAQVQLFEQEVSGIQPYAGFRWNSEISQYVAGFEYNTEGRTTVGFAFSSPLKDTLSFNEDLQSFKLNPYGIFEFIEPGPLNIFSFAMKASFEYENVFASSKTYAVVDSSVTPPEPSKVEEPDFFRRTTLGAGPIFGLRLVSGDHFTFIPLLSYEFQYVTFQRRAVEWVEVSPGIFEPRIDDNTNKDGELLWHQLNAGVAVMAMFDEMNGINVEPRLTVLLGEGRKSSDLLNASVQLGYVRRF